MPPQSRGDQHKPLPLPAGFQSKSTPNLPTLRSLETTNSSPITLHPGQAGSPDIITSPSEAASVDDFSLDSSVEPPSLSPASSGPEDVSEDEDEEDGYVPNLPPRPFHHQHSRFHMYLAPSAFAPPFYNRPPTPLPPSPSLTSLLRPNFSTTTSRPTTPDPSSDEGGPHTRSLGGTTGTQTPNSGNTLTSAAALAQQTIPRASPKVPTYEYYGFTLYLTSSLAFIVYLLWSYLPSPFLHQLGIYYYPNRWWALAIPAWTVMLVVYIYVALACYNTGYLTLKMADVGCLVDEAANVAVVDAQGKIIRQERPSWEVVGEKEKHAGKKGRGKNGGHSRRGSLGKVQVHQELDWRALWNEGTDAVMDIPIGGVCEILYGQAEDEEDELYD
ncbi:hypothetical protein B0A55_02082 [Friedmanniomyces simplex]|uniref:PIG-P domain-containing protein n=1 Tax=Friedmanniomyces simplex TaxID=329884 RepID=A0A4U0XTT5_9PEZI|nr:hypothetical protein B0A55_02082 [Friedmanniomyces simplex]